MSGRVEDRNPLLLQRHLLDLSTVLEIADNRLRTNDTRQTAQGGRGDVRSGCEYLSHRSLKRTTGLD